MKNKNIFIIGRSEGSYRTQNLIKYLLDNKYELYFNSFSITTYKKSIGLKKVLRKIIRLVDEVIRRTFIIYNILLSDIVILPALCNRYKFELKISKYFNKIIVVDFYISIYDTIILDRKTHELNSKEASYLFNLDLNILENSNYIFFLNQAEANYYLSPFNIEFNSLRHRILPLCVEEFFKCELNYVNGKSEVFNICWWGNYIPLHGLDKIIMAIYHLNESSDINFHLYLFGNKNINEELKYSNLIKSLNLEKKVTIKNDYTFKNRKLGDFLIKNCDLVLGNFGDSKKAKNVLVNKVVDGVAMRAPVLTGESIAPKEYFNEETIFYSKNEPQLIAREIIKVAKINQVIIQNRVKDSYLIFQNKFSVEAFYKNLDLFFNSLS